MKEPTEEPAAPRELWHAFEFDEIDASRTTCRSNTNELCFFSQSGAILGAVSRRSNQKYFGNQYQYKNPRYNNKNNRSKDRFNPYYNKGNKGMNKGKSREGGGYYGQRGAPPDQNYYNIGDPYQFIRTPLPMSFVGQPSYIPTSSVGQNSYGVPLGYVSPSGSYMPQGFRY